MIGKLIPAGTGMKRYKNIDLDYGVNAEIMESYEREKELEEMQAMEEAASYEEAEEALDLSEKALEEEMPEIPEIVELD